jgi:hypothetical protein
LNLEGARRGEDAAEVGVLTVGVVVRGMPKEGTETWWRGDAGRRRLDSDPVLLYRPDTVVPARGVSSNSASSEMSHMLGATSNEPIEAGRMPEPYRSWGIAVCGRVSNARGLRVRFGDRRGDAGRASGIGEGESMRLPVGCITVGSEWARVMGGAVGRLEPLWERR